MKWDDFCLVFLKSLVTTSSFRIDITGRKDTGYFGHVLSSRPMLIFVFLALGARSQRFFTCRLVRLRKKLLSRQ